MSGGEAKITDEAVEAAAAIIVQGDRGACECRRSIFDKHDVNPPCSTRSQAIRSARAALEAAAPHIMAQALEEAADELAPGRLTNAYSNGVYKWLRDRAKSISQQN